MRRGNGASERAREERANARWGEARGTSVMATKTMNARKNPSRTRHRRMTML
jgi:hypothetical protein